MGDQEYYNGIIESFRMKKTTTNLNQTEFCMCNGTIYKESLNILYEHPKMFTCLIWTFVILAIREQILAKKDIFKETKVNFIKFIFGPTLDDILKNTENMQENDSIKNSEDDQEKYKLYKNSTKVAIAPKNIDNEKSKFPSLDQASSIHVNENIYV